MNNSVFRFSVPENEPVHDYAPGSTSRALLKQELERMASTVIDIPLIIGGKEIRTGKTVDVVMPTEHGHVLARAHMAGEAEVRLAIDAALAAQGGMVHAVVGRARLGDAEGGRAAVEALPLPHQRRDDAGAGEERVPGRDRRRLRGHRLPALQRLLRVADLHGAAAVAARPPQPARVPAARGLRLHGQPVQLHRDRVEPEHGRRRSWATRRCGSPPPPPCCRATS